MNKLLTSPRTKRAANVLGIVLLIAVVAPFAVFAVPEVVGADESFVVLTASMTPAIAPGDVVVVAERDPTAIAEGDVITFVRGTSDVPVTHRVIGVTGEGATLAFETMGDANEGPDPGLVPAGNLVGVVTLTIPYIGYVIQFAGTGVGFVALVLLPFGLLAVTEVWSIVRGRDESGAEAPAAAATTAADSEADTSDGDGPGAAADAGESVSTVTTASAEETAEIAESGSGGVSVDAVGGAAAVLAAFAPYAAYVAFELRTAVAIAVAVAAGTLLFGAIAMWVPASGVLDRSGRSSAPTSEDVASGPTAAADGGSAEPEPSGDEGAAEPDGSAESAESEESEPTAAATPPARPDAAGEVD